MRDIWEFYSRKVNQSTYRSYWSQESWRISDEYLTLDTSWWTWKMICNRSIYRIDILGKRKYQVFATQTYTWSSKYSKSKIGSQVRWNSPRWNEWKVRWNLSYSNLIKILSNFERIYFIWFIVCRIQSFEDLGHIQEQIFDHLQWILHHLQNLWWNSAYMDHRELHQMAWFLLRQFCLYLFV